MSVVYLSFIVFLFVLAVFDLMVGVSNDAVNFLNSAVGAKVARFRTIMLVAAFGIFVGATMSNGMMDIARHGICRPEMFSFYDMMCIFLAVMTTDVVLLDVFNTLGLPTSTTVSMVFELLGGTFILALLKIIGDHTGSLGFAELLNTEKALSVIMGIFLSVAIAFFFGTVVQWITRLIFSFNYKKNLGWFIGLFGGTACTAIGYFIFIKGLKDAPYLDPSVPEWIDAHTGRLVVLGFVGFTVLMQVLHWLHVNVFKFIVLLGTFALAMAFAGNDLVNFIGVPLAGFSSYTDFMANGAGNDHGFMMSSLMTSAKTPLYFLVIAACIMIYSLMTSKKARNVIKTSVDLSRQDEGEEMFGTSKAARSLVRFFNSAGEVVCRYVPRSVQVWINSRFNKDEAILADGAAFDLVRASVNLVLASLLIIMGTSLKLPLSTTYITFIVAMGSSLSDRAWSRESAVFRVTGVLSVIGGWFITAGVAFTICAIVTLAMYFGGEIVMVLLVLVAVGILVRNNVHYGKKQADDELTLVFKEMMASKDKGERWTLLRRHVALAQQGVLDFVWRAYDELVGGFVKEDLRAMRRILREVDEQKEMFQKLRQKELIGMRRIDRQISLEYNTWFHLGCNSAEQVFYGLKRLGNPCRDHVDNNFSPLPQLCIDELEPVRKQIVDYAMRSERIVEDRDYSQIEPLLLELDTYKDTLSVLRQRNLDRMQDEGNNLKTSLVYLNILQESQELLSTLRHFLRAFNKFQN
jgi:hypothetical protein